MEKKDIEKIGKIYREGKNCLFLDVDASNIRGAVSKIVMGGVKRLTSIAGVDNGKQIEAIYIFDDDYRTISLRAMIPRDNARIDSIKTIVPAATLFEREFSEMLDVKVEGNAEPERLFLAPDSPRGPLRKNTANDS